MHTRYSHAHEILCCAHNIILHTHTQINLCVLNITSYFSKYVHNFQFVQSKYQFIFISLDTFTQKQFSAPASSISSIFKAKISQFKGFIYIAYHQITFDLLVLWKLYEKKYCIDLPWTPTMAMLPCLAEEPCPWGHEIYNFGRPFLACS